ncbi:Polyribonucleotide nucleotidyltransferase [Methanimicrococcus stummii]|uniref:Exosome complex component Rrp41 n=1 Tax=Methanimicrococcus stummii TaxID=3028294 RepID=A0AA96ZWW8_9EURY|nr:exosome complex exonuclease Rrp41 [Methanimicrococcus sp. Es2]WNY28279.1 Polyribonucleotide nucleotidyltransferase [Methanimicrococcus sp. Es2]
MSSNQTDVVFFDENGLRTDQRKPDEIRPMKIKIGVLSRANGSCYLEWGANKILAAVYGPREAHPRRIQLANRAVIRYRYNMQSFSVEDRARPGPSRRSSEISKVSREAFEPVLFPEDYPKAAIDIFVEVLQADAGTRTAAINAASLALVDAGIPMRGLVSACAAGKVDGKIVLDLNKPEDNYGDADLPIAMTEDGKITLIQMDGHLTPSEFEEAMDLVQKGCRQVLEIQKAALLEKFASVMDDDDEEVIEEEIEDEDEIENSGKGNAAENDDDFDDFENDSEGGSADLDDEINAFVAEVSERLAKDVSAIIRSYENEDCDIEDDDLDIVVIEDEEMDADDLKEIEKFVSDFDDDSDDDSDEESDDEETDIFIIEADDLDESDADEDAEFDDDFDEDEEEE